MDDLFDGLGQIALNPLAELCSSFTLRQRRRKEELGASLEAVVVSVDDDSQ